MDAFAGHTIDVGPDTDRGSRFHDLAAPVRHRALHPQIIVAPPVMHVHLRDAVSIAALAPC